MSLLDDKVSLPIDNDVLRLLGFHPTTLITTISQNGSINVAPMGWVTIVDYNPPQFLFSVNIKHDTYRNVLETGEFVVNIPSWDLLPKVFVCAKASGRTIDKFKESGLTPQGAQKLATTPRIVECAGNIECKLFEVKEAGDHYIFIGEAVAALAEKEYFSDGFWDTSKVELIFHLGAKYFFKSPPYSDLSK